MPDYSGEFLVRARKSLELAFAGDVAAQDGSWSGGSQAWHYSRVEFLYEMAFLRIFVEWEMFLEKTFVRYLCGYSSINGQLQTVAGNYFSSVASAELAILNGQSFLLWHNPGKVIARSQRWFNAGPHERVVTSIQSRLGHFSAIRHRIAHGHQDTKHKFDQATMNISGRRYPGARPGRFLRDWNASSTPRERWLETLVFELGSLARQIA